MLCLSDRGSSFLSFSIGFSWSFIMVFMYFLMFVAARCSALQRVIAR
jgi:hypothetical protein